MSNVNEELDLFLTRKLLDLHPNCVIKKEVVEGENEDRAKFYLYIPGKRRLLLARGFDAAKQAVQVYKDNLLAEQGEKA